MDAIQRALLLFLAPVLMLNGGQEAVVDAQSAFPVSGAGLVLRITEQGLLQLKRLIPMFIENAFRDASPKDVFFFNHNNRLVNLTGMHVSEIDEPVNMDVHFTNDPNAPILVEIKNMEFRLGASVEIGLPKTRSGKGKMNIKNFRMRTGLRISADARGSPMFVATHCEVNLRKVIYHFEAKRISIAEPHRIQNAMKEDLIHNFCDAVMRRGLQTINSNIRKSLAESKVFDVDFDADKTEIPKNLYDLLKLMGPRNRQKFVDFAQRLRVNTALVAEPRVVSNPPMLEMQMRGDMQMDGMPPAPFHVKPFSTNYYNPGRLVNVFISENTFQSLLYYVYKHGLLDFTLSRQETPFLNSFLATTGCKGICLGSIIPDLAKQYPNANPEISVKALGPLSTTMSNGRAIITGKFNTVLTVMKNKTRIPILSAIATPTVDYRLHPLTVSLRGEAKVADLKLNLKNTTLKSMTNAKLVPLAQGAKVFMSKFISGVASGGLPLPKLPFGSWHSLTMKPMNNAMYLEYDFVPNQEVIQKLVNGLFSKSLFYNTVRPFIVPAQLPPILPVGSKHAVERIYQRGV